MRKYIDNEYREVITEEVHSKSCNFKAVAEFSKKIGNKVVIKYRYCPKCGKYIEGEDHNITEEYF